MGSMRGTKISKARLSLRYLVASLWDAVVQRCVLCLVTRWSQVRIYLKPLCSIIGQVAHPLLSVRKATGSHLTHLIPGTCLWARNHHHSLSMDWCFDIITMVSCSFLCS